jgi:hypothetical protein
MRLDGAATCMALTDRGGFAVSGSGAQPAMNSPAATIPAATRAKAALLS